MMNNMNIIINKFIYLTENFYVDNVIRRNISNILHFQENDSIVNSILKTIEPSDYIRYKIFNT